jgi:hypothetical protein
MLVKFNMKDIHIVNKKNTGFPESWERRRSKRQKWWS